LDQQAPVKLSGAETLKAGSCGLRGDIAREIAGQPRGGVSEASYNLLKFHGTYEQFDRDTATVRKQGGDDKEWQFMLAGELVSLRITGCPNGCVRPYAGDIGVVVRIPGQYAIFVGGDFAGTRLSFKLLERVPMVGIGATLDPLFAAFAAHRTGDEGFGDFCTRMGLPALLALLPSSQAAQAAE
jgi:sulfite reductase beta subunit-like hemoprotein